MAFQQINGKQIKPNSIIESHINGKLPEKVLDIDWENASHAQAILKNKIITDYVQLDKEVTFGANNSTNTIGLSLDSDANKLPCVVLNQSVRFRTTDGDPVIDDQGKEVVCKIIKNNGSNEEYPFAYTIALFDSVGKEFIPKTALAIELLYPIKTTLWDAVENFAANERFIDGAVDIRSKLDINQLAKDIFGDKYTFKENGNATREINLLDELTNRTIGSMENTKKITATDIINEIFSARGGEEDLGVRLTKMAASSSEAVSTLVDRVKVSIDEKGKLVDSRLHTHGSCTFKFPTNSTSINFNTLNTPEFKSTTLNTDANILEVYLNGSLLVEDIHYKLVISDKYITGIDFTPEEIKADTDLITLKWITYSV